MAPVVPLQVLQEAEEQSVHGHGVHTEERAEGREGFTMAYAVVVEILPGNEVASYHNEYNGGHEKVE